MLELPDRHPDTYSMLSQGDFGVRHTTTHGFLQLPVNQTIKQTLNSNTKNKDGIIGFSLESLAVQQWTSTAHARARFLEQCREMASSLPQEKRKDHKESGSVCNRKEWRRRAEGHGGNQSMVESIWEGRWPRKSELRFCWKQRFEGRPAKSRTPSLH